MKKHITVFLFILFVTCLSELAFSEGLETALCRINKYYPNSRSTQPIVIDISEQRLYLLKNDSISRSFIVSTSKYGIGNHSGSNKTPLGLHKIKKKIGGDVPLGGILKGRKYINNIAKIYLDATDLSQDLVTSRILWLEGLEKGINRGKGISSFQRYIYIHGTNEEGLIGTPSSHGCIRMKNKDVIGLFDLVTENTPVYIQE